jgi:hypothetical protein
MGEGAGGRCRCRHAPADAVPTTSLESHWRRISLKLKNPLDWCSPPAGQTPLPATAQYNPLHVPHLSQPASMNGSDVPAHNGTTLLAPLVRGKVIHLGDASLGREE